MMQLKKFQLTLIILILLLQKMQFLTMTSQTLKKLYFQTLKGLNKNENYFMCLN